MRSKALHGEAPAREIQLRPMIPPKKQITYTPNDISLRIHTGPNEMKLLRKL